MENKTYRYRGHELTVKRNSYANNGTLAVCLCNLDGSLYDVITTNLNHPMQSDTMAFLDTNNLPGIEMFVEKNGLGLPMHYTARSGFCEYPLYTLFV